MLKEYHKIETLFERDEKTKKLIKGIIVKIKVRDFEE